MVSSPHKPNILWADFAILVLAMVCFTVKEILRGTCTPAPHVHFARAHLATHATVDLWEVRALCSLSGLVVRQHEVAPPQPVSVLACASVSCDLGQFRHCVPFHTATQQDNLLST